MFILFFGTFFLSFVAVPVCLIAAKVCLIYERKHPDALRESARMFMVVMVFAGIMIAVYVSSTANGQILSFAIKHVPMRLQPLVDALERYKSVNGSYPETLGLLVPDTLGELPNTGYVMYPNYTYRPPPENDLGTHFHIYIHPPSVTGGAPGIAYCPDGEYSRDAHHYLSKTRVGNWVYSPYEYRELSDQTGGARIWDDGMRIRE